MDATAQTYIDAGDATQIRDGLSQSEDKQFLTIIGKQISDHKDTVILKAYPQFGQNRLASGDYKLDDLKKVVAQNVNQINKHKFKYCSRIRECVEHTHDTVHKRPLPDHMRQQEVNNKKQKTDQLNFDSEPKTEKSISKSWSPNPNQRKSHTGGPFKHGCGRGGDTPIPMVGIVIPLRGNIQKVKRVKLKVRVEEKAIKEEIAKAKVKRRLPKGSTLTKSVVIVA